MEVLIDNRSNEELTEKQEELIRRVIDEAEKFESAEPAEVSLSIVENEEIQALNRQYRGMDKPTDVLSFPQEPVIYGDFSEIDDFGMDILGDIVISIRKAQEQAEEYGHSLERELGFLVCHGMLHLLGYDHESPAEEKEMNEKQEKILQNAGVHR